MTKPQENRVKAGPQIGSQVEFFSVRTSLDIQPGLAVLTLPANGVDASEIEKETAGQKRLDALMAIVGTFAQPLMLKISAVGAADGNGDTQGVTFAFEHVGAATVATLTAAITAGMVAYGDASAATEFTVTAM